MANRANIGVHVAGKFGSDVETEAGRAGAHGDGSGFFEPTTLHFAPNIHRKSGAIIADLDDDFVVIVFDKKFGNGFFAGIVHGI